jgi:hypothetical protein
MCNLYVCGTGACKTSCTTTADCQSPYVCIASACVPPINITVSLEETNTSNTKQVTPNFHIVNNGTSAITLSQLTVRYWYTVDEASPSAQTASCDYTFLSGSCAAITGITFGQVNPAKTNADYYLQFGFATGLSLAPSGGTTGDIQVRWNKNDFSVFTFSNDYSYNASTTTWTATTKVTVYLNGVLVYGTEPT